MIRESYGPAIASMPFVPELTHQQRFDKYFKSLPAETAYGAKISELYTNFKTTVLNNLQPETLKLNLKTIFTKEYFVLPLSLSRFNGRFAYIACAIAGLKERIDYNNKIMNVCLGIFAASVGAVFYAGTKLAGKVKILTLGVGIVGAVASTIAYFMQRRDQKHVVEWYQTLMNLFKAPGEASVNRLKKFIDPKAISNEDLPLFKPQARDAMAYFDYRNATPPNQWNNYMVNAVFGKAMIVANIKRAQDKGPDAQFAENMQIAERSLAIQRSGISQEEQFLIDLGKKSADDLKKDLEAITFPTNLSIGHFLLLNVVDNLSLYSEDQFEKNGKLKPNGLGENLAGFKRTLQHAQKWLGKFNYKQEQDFIKAGLKCKTEKELHALAKSLDASVVSKWDGLSVANY